MTAPSQPTYMTLIGSVNGTPPQGSGWSVLANSASSLTKSALYTANGFSATAFVNTQTSQIVVAIAGVGTVSATGALAQGATSVDTAIMGANTSIISQLQTVANTFMGEVQAAASALPSPLMLNSNNTFVTGLSIGGVYAQLAAQYKDIGFGGANFGGPGIPGNGQPGSQQSNFANYGLAGDYLNESLDEFEPSAASFDLVVSSLALHYIADYPRVVRRVAACLVPGGRFAFSVEHPIVTAHGTADWHVAPDGTRLHWPVDRYRDEGERHTHWFVDGVVKYHRTVETYVNGLLDAGLVLARIEEPEAEPAALAEHPEWRDERRRPPFLLLAADRPR